MEFPDPSSEGRAEGTSECPAGDRHRACPVLALPGAPILGKVMGGNNITPSQL